MNNVLVVVSGPAGVGKGTIVNNAVKLSAEQGTPLYLSVSMTSRPMSNQDSEGITYFFVTADEFRASVDAGDLLEYNCYNGNYYGTPKGNVIKHLSGGEDVILEIDINGGSQIKESYPDVIRVFIMPPSMEELEARIRGRARDSEEDILRRLETARSEIASADNYDYIIVNNTIEQATAELFSIIAAEKCRVCRNKNLIKEVLKDD